MFFCRHSNKIASHWGIPSCDRVPGGFVHASRRIPSEDWLSLRVDQLGLTPFFEGHLASHQMLARNLARITLARSMGTPPQQQAPATGEQHGGSSSDNKQHASVTLPPGVAQTRVTLLYGSYASPDVGVHQNYICFTAAEIDAIVTLVLKGRTGDLTEGRVRACLADFLGEGRGEVIVVPINCPIREPYYGPYRIHTRGTFSYRRERPQDRRAYAVPLFDFDLRLHKRYKEHPFYISYRSSKDNQLHLLAISIAKFTLAKDKALAKAASQSEVNKAMLEWLARLKTAFVKLDKTLEDFGTRQNRGGLHAFDLLYMYSVRRSSKLTTPCSTL